MQALAGIDVEISSAIKYVPALAVDCRHIWCFPSILIHLHMPRIIVYFDRDLNIFKVRPEHFCLGRGTESASVTSPSREREMLEMVRGKFSIWHQPRLSAVLLV